MQVLPTKHLASDFNTPPPLSIYINRRLTIAHPLAIQSNLSATTLQCSDDVSLKAMVG